jgi:hypothetical protein
VRIPSILAVLAPPPRPRPWPRHIHTPQSHTVRTPPIDARWQDRRIGMGPPRTSHGTSHHACLHARRFALPVSRYPSSTLLPAPCHAPFNIYIAHTPLSHCGSVTTHRRLPHASDRRYLEQAGANHSPRSHCWFMLSPRQRPTRSAIDKVLPEALVLLLSLKDERDRCVRTALGCCKLSSHFENVRVAFV